MGSSKIDARMLRYYAAGLAVVLACIFVCVQWGTEYPILQVLALGVCTFVGKLLGMPLEAVFTHVMQKRPDMAVKIAIDALQSLPPEAAEEATKQLISSIPPAAIQRVVLVNTSEPPPEPPPKP